MPSLADLEACAVEIQVPLPDGKWRHGSGYVIGPCRILTALHVLVGPDAVKQGQPVSAPARIEVRAFGDFAERFGRAPASACAPSEGNEDQPVDGRIFEKVDRVSEQRH
jgi:hypothetical protein